MASPVDNRTSVTPVVPTANQYCINETLNKVIKFLDQHKYVLLFAASVALSLAFAHDIGLLELKETLVAGAITGAGFGVAGTIMGLKVMKEKNTNDKIFFLFSVIILGTTYLCPAAAPLETLFCAGMLATQTLYFQLFSSAKPPKPIAE